MMSSSLRKIGTGLTIGTFNVRGLSSQTKRHQLANDLASYDISVCCLQETKCREPFDEIFENGTRIIGLPSDSQHYGLGFAVRGTLRDSLSRYWRLSDRVAGIQFKLPNKRHSLLTVINVYGPTSGRVSVNSDEQDEFFDALNKSVLDYGSNSFFFLAGDFNSKLGIRTTNEAFMGRHARGRRNLNGNVLANFLDAHRLYAANTSFQHSARHQTTWQGQRRDAATDTVVPIYNTIDYIVCRQNQKQLLTDSRSYAGTCTSSDHRLVVARLDVSRIFGVLGKQQQRTKSNPRIAAELLIQPETREQYQSDLNNNLCNGVTAPSSSQEAWNTISKKVLDVAKDCLGVVQPQRRRQDFCPKIEKLSVRQKELRLAISNTSDVESATILKRERNAVLHDIRKLALANASAQLDQRATEINQLHDGAKMFRAVQLMKRKQHQPPVIHDELKRVVVNPVDRQKYIISHYNDQFNNPSSVAVPAFIGEPEPLRNPITASEVSGAFKRLKNGRACGPDDMAGELLKYGPPVLAEFVAEIFNSSLEEHDPLDIGKGTLILLQKPGKPLGPVSSTRPIVLLSSLRKTLSLIVLRRIQPKVDGYLSVSQSAFRRGRSTSDVVWCHRWLCAMTQRCQASINILGLDMSRAFDTVQRDILLNILASFLDSSEIRMIQLLLSNTWLEPRVPGASPKSFQTTVGIPQGDSLSPVLFTIYLEAALRDLRNAVAPLPRADVCLPFDVEYADDVDFVSTDLVFLQRVEHAAPQVLATWNLLVNPAKTEYTYIHRASDRINEEWRTTKKLGSLLGDAEDAARRRTLAGNAFRSLYSVWLRRQQISESLRLKLYEAYIVPILLYNSGTWALTNTELCRMDAFHRTQLRRILDISHPRHISNETLYKRTKSSPLSDRIAARGFNLKAATDLKQLRTMAMNRSAWRKLF